MTLWRVRRYIDGVWDGVAPRAIEAETIEAAAEMFLKSSLEESPEGCTIAVWRGGDIPIPTYFRA